MCGIYGYFNTGLGTVPDRKTFSFVLSLISHRGPDERGIYSDEKVSLGIQRLTIIDLKTGSQPITNEDGNLIIVYNGEIYNFPELMAGLKKKGHIFKSATDTETILHLYEEYGEKCLDYLNGMFAFAIYDRSRDKLFLARDRSGIKPLFYSWNASRLVFGSEIKLLLNTAGVSREIDRPALIDYFSYYYISSPDTIYRDIRALPPGCFLTIEKGRCEIKRYWNMEYRPDYSLKENDIIDSIIETLRSSVKRQLISDVPVGIYLSGGMDSTAMISALGEQAKGMNCYTVGYKDEKSYSEIEYASAVSSLYGAVQNNCYIDENDIVNELPGLLTHLDQPCGDWTVFGLNLLSKVSRSKIKVALSGLGGDELFGGYPTVNAGMYARYYKMLPEPAKQLIKKAVSLMPASHKYLSYDFIVRQFLRGTCDDIYRSHMQYKEIFNKDERELLLKGELAEENRAADPFRVFARNLDILENSPLIKSSDPDSRREGDSGSGASSCKFIRRPGRDKSLTCEELNRLLYLDFKIFMPEDTLYVTDMATMRNSQECRVPFLDNELIDLSSRIPPEMKFRGLTTKYIFRKAMKKLLPEKILKQRKRGFTLPVAEWLKKPVLGSFIDRIVTESDRASSCGLNFDYIRRIIKEHNAGKENHSRRIMCLVSFLLWHRKM